MILDALTTELMHDNLARNIDMDLSAIPAMTSEGVKETLHKSNERIKRLSQLQEFELYCFEEQMSVKLTAQRGVGKPSLLQLYKIAKNTGVFEQFYDHYSKLEKRPLI